MRNQQSDITLYERPLLSHRLSLMGFRLTGIVLFSAVSDPSEIKRAIDALTPTTLKFWNEWSHRIPVLPGKEDEQYKLLQAFFANGQQGVTDEMLRSDDIYRQSRLTGPLIAYVPDDPNHPLKEYASLSEFLNTLIGQLRETDYQAFFSRFVAHKDKGRFFRESTNASGRSPGSHANRWIWARGGAKPRSRILMLNPSPTSSAAISGRGCFASGATKPLPTPGKWRCRPTMKMP